MSEKTGIDGGKFCADCKGKCCSGCAYAGGYFNRKLYPSDRKRFTEQELTVIDEIHDAHPERFQVLIHKLAELLGVTFDKKVGFGGPTGCRIPREKRSWTCREYFCRELSKHLGFPEDRYWGMPPKEDMGTLNKK